VARAKRASRIAHLESVRIADDPSSASIGDRKCNSLPPDPAVKPMTDSSYLRDKAEQALLLARSSTDRVLVKSLIEVAAESLGRADAIDLVTSLKEVAAAFGEEG